RVKGHVYRAGSWLSETDVKAGSVLVLRGVKSGGQSLSSLNFSILLSGCWLTPRGRAATIWLPKPKAILELLHATASAQPGFIARRKDTGLQFPELATVHVLCYDYDDENEVFLEGHYWEPTPTGDAISLHLISTSPGLEGTEHQIVTEDAMTKLIHG